MNNSYSEQDLTIIIPTFGDNEEGLKNLILALKSESSEIRIIVVWDNVDNISASLNLLFSKLSIDVVCHAINRGRAAARNTGILHCSSSLGMFIDDDIRPLNPIISKVIAFHNEYSSELDMVIGKVTWEGSAHCSTLTQWYERAGHWNLFSNSTHMQLLSNFMTGFTSFKASIFKRLSLDESFKKYGCEDTEFGYRYFAQGGKLYFSEEMIGIHDKNLPLIGYCHQHIEAGYSKGLLSTIHPDLVFKVDYFYHAICLYNAKSHLDEYISHTDLLLNLQGNNLMLEGHLDTNMSFLTELCMAIGFIDYYKEKYNKAQPNIDLLLGCESFSYFSQQYATLNDIPFFLVEQSIQEENLEIKTSLLLEAIKRHPHYAKPYIELAYLNPNLWLEQLKCFYDGRKNNLDSNTKMDIEKLLGGSEFIDSISLNPREKYLYLVKNENSLTSSEVKALCESILISDPTFVSAYIMLAKMKLNTNKSEAEMYLTIASFFAKGRPLNEKLLRERDIKTLMNSLKDKK